MKYFPTTLLSVFIVIFSYVGNAIPSGHIPDEVLSLNFPEADRISPYVINIPFRMSGLHIVIMAEVDGKPGNFILDTGSEKLILNARHFDGGWVKKGRGSVGTFGIVSKVRSCMVKNLSWQDMSAQNINADIIDLSHMEERKNIQLLGLIGYEVIKNFELLIDFKTQKVILLKTDETGKRFGHSSREYAPVDSLNISIKQHFIILNGIINGQKVTFGLDSGAELNLLDQRANRRVLGHFEVIQQMVVNDIGGQAAREVPVGKLQGFQAQHFQWPVMRTMLADLTHLNQLLGTRLDGVLGMEFFTKRPVIINYKKRMLYFLDK